MKRLALLICIIAGSSGCSTDFDVTAPYKEIIVIDGFLNVVDSIQNIRVSKAFLGDGNAYVMAQQSDSINYANILDVKMDRILNGNVVETFPLTRGEYYDKDSGIFHYPYHVMYSTNHPIVSDNSLYRISVTNTETGVTATSTTKIVGDVVLRVPNPPNPPPPPPPTFPRRDSIDLASQWVAPYDVKFNPGVNAKIFDLILIFRYREIDPSGNSTEHAVAWNFVDQTTANQQNEVVFIFYKYDLFNYIGASIPDKPGYIRRTDSLSNGARTFEFKIVQGSEDLEIYYGLQQPSSSIVQEPPSFTTVENGLGIFTSRVIHSFSYYPNDLTADSLENSLATRSKNFQF